MNIVIPLCGKGTRFSEYKTPKPLIRVLGKPMVEHVLDHIETSPEDKIFIIHNGNLDSYRYKRDISYIRLEGETSGAAETLLLGIDIIVRNHIHHKSSIIIDCDTFYTQDIVSMYRELKGNAIFYRKQEDSREIYSYIKLNGDRVQDIVEKKKISDNANTGAYCFADINELRRYCYLTIQENLRFKGEYYTSCVISRMLKDSIPFLGISLDPCKVFSLGTPVDVNEYLSRTYTFLFDLDGTLVNTDSIYLRVWKDILLDYNIHLTDEMFRNCIQGNSDAHVANTLLHSLDIDLKSLSFRKDTLFLKHISSIETIPGSLEFIEKVYTQGHPCCVVTNCNRRVAMEILRVTGIGRYIETLVAADDCVRNKPHPDPYQKAIDLLGVENHRCIIFEDSRSGIISGRSVNPKLLVGVTGRYNHKQLLELNVDMTIDTFKDLELDILNTENSSYELLSNKIMQSLKDIPVESVKIKDTKLKGGYIADIVEVDIFYSLGTIPAVFKYEASGDNDLAVMARRLELYAREYYFYRAVSSYVNIDIPKYISVVTKDDKDIGILLERIDLQRYHLNLNLNEEPIEVSLGVISEMAKLHARFWNKDLKQLFPQLELANGKLFNPFIPNFIRQGIDNFKSRWGFLIDSDLCDDVSHNIDSIIDELFSSNLTFIHGDIKSPNTFYDKITKKPLFIDWQHCCIGKGVQDLAFFIVESFEVSSVRRLLPLFKSFYYQKILEYGISYPYERFEKDFTLAMKYIPFFTAVWFGNTNPDDLIDKNFPYLLIQKLSVIFE